MGWKVFRIGCLLSLLVVLVAIWLRPGTEREIDAEVRAILRGLIDVETPDRVRKPKVAVGYGACMDVFTNAKDVLQFKESDLDPGVITNDVELMQAYTYFFRHGAAAERFVHNSSLFDMLVEQAEQVPGARWEMGGTAAVMANRFSLEGCDVLLGAKMTPRLLKAFSPNVKVVGGDVSKDDVHLILEYKAGETWGSFQAPRANRFILHNDDTNPTLSSLEDFQAALEAFEPDLLVVGGLQMMDNFPFQKGVREARLKLVEEQMRKQSTRTRVHFELASFAEPKLMIYLVDRILPHADSLGMNEQELENLKSIILHQRVSVVTDSNPRVATVLDDMREVFKQLRHKGKQISGSRSLTRIHVHTLAYQAILTVHGSPWKNSIGAAAKASLTAHRHVCGSASVDVEKALLMMDESFSTSTAEGSKRMPLNVTSPITCWDEECDGTTINLCVAPVLVCTHAKQTCGGGDNISSAGISMQI
ncbi:ADP-dependent glucokinase-like [Frankliniella occidentalis]|uniref:ADP-dependent glucokinase n=1 Tax=Frankliniella occidentalis TaxID=133901 RepID=A0A6J1T6L2_FRAOC|nr:ADP-dependent glucokinase [Frankliniella occidentalis]XP_052129220.1 ADP-dependent glucokinase-like [Frankliniella occidentalis]